MSAAAHACAETPESFSFRVSVNLPIPSFPQSNTDVRSEPERRPGPSPGSAVTNTVRHLVVRVYGVHAFPPPTLSVYGIRRQRSRGDYSRARPRSCCFSLAVLLSHGCGDRRVDGKTVVVGRQQQCL